MYYYDDDNEYEDDGEIVTKTREEGNVVFLQAAMNTSVPAVRQSAEQYMKENRNKNGEPFLRAVVELVFSSIEVINPEYATIVQGQQSLSSRAEKQRDEGRGM